MGLRTSSPMRMSEASVHRLVLVEPEGVVVGCCDGGGALGSGEGEAGEVLVVVGGDGAGDRTCGGEAVVGVGVGVGVGGGHSVAGADVFDGAMRAVGEEDLCTGREAMGFGAVRDASLPVHTVDQRLDLDRGQGAGLDEGAGAERDAVVDDSAAACA